MTRPSHSGTSFLTGCRVTSAKTTQATNSQSGVNQRQIINKQTEQKSHREQRNGRENWGHSSCGLRFAVLSQRAAVTEAKTGGEMGQACWARPAHSEVLILSRRNAKQLFSAVAPERASARHCATKQDRAPRVVKFHAAVAGEIKSEMQSREGRRVTGGRQAIDCLLWTVVGDVRRWVVGPSFLLVDGGYSST